ncbi:MAG: hypothetical protein M3Q31_12680 [Actinomycetota bacterium]|nr:hypothetical protein [Actinomycetota bacterium]
MSSDQHASKKYLFRGGDRNGEDVGLTSDEVAELLAEGDYELRDEEPVLWSTQPDPDRGD